MLTALSDKALMDRIDEARDSNSPGRYELAEESRRRARAAAAAMTDRELVDRVREDWRVATIVELVSRFEALGTKVQAG